MLKYYTRACNFYYGSQAKLLIKKKHALPLCGIKSIAFDSVEIFIREKRQIRSKIIKIQNIKNLHKAEKKKFNKTWKILLQREEIF